MRISDWSSDVCSSDLFFSEMAVVTFGGAYAVLAYVAQQAVTIYGWLSPDQMLHGLGLAETTPGPLLLVLTFVRFVAGFEHGGFASPLFRGLAGGLPATLVHFWRGSEARLAGEACV